MDNSNIRKEEHCNLHNPNHQAFHLLQLAFIIIPLVAGLDKFFNFLTPWQQYLSPEFNVLGDAPTTMRIVGVIEIIAGIGVWLKPRIFAYVVALWMLATIINILTLGAHYDIALRDFGLMLGALALGSLSKAHCCHKIV